MRSSMNFQTVRRGKLFLAIIDIAREKLLSHLTTTTHSLSGSCVVDRGVVDCGVPQVVVRDFFFENVLELEWTSEMT